MNRLLKLPRIVPVIVVLVIFGLIRSPFEDGIRRKMVEAQLLLPPPGHTAMQQMSQSALMGTLGGLRSLVATFLVLEAFGHFSNKEWDELQKNYTLITNLEPRDESHWESVVWHLGINATANMEIDTKLPAFERKRRFNKYALAAIEMGELGLKQLPHSSAIRIQLAEVYREKLKDPCETARLYKDCIGLEGAPGYVDRFYGYFLADCAGNEKEAYEYLMNLYRAEERHHKGTLIQKIEELEEKLGIPESERIPGTRPKRPSPGDKKKRQDNVLPGGIVIP